MPDPTGAEPHLETYLYCRPRVLDTEHGEGRVDTLLRSLALELGLPEAPSFRDGHDTSISVPGDPHDVWEAVDRVSTYWTQRELFLLPGSYGPWSERF